MAKQEENTVILQMGPGPGETIAVKVHGKLEMELGDIARMFAAGTTELIGQLRQMALEAFPGSDAEAANAEIAFFRYLNDFLNERKPSPKEPKRGNHPSRHTN